MTEEALLELGLDKEMAGKIAAESIKELSGYISKEQHEADINNFKKQSAIDNEIFKAKGKDAKIIKSVLNMDEIGFDENGNLSGLDLKKVSEQYPYLFNIETSRIEGTGHSSGNSISRDEAFKKRLDEAMGIKRR